MRISAFASLAFSLSTLPVSSATAADPLAAKPAIILSPSMHMEKVDFLKWGGIQTISCDGFIGEGEVKPELFGYKEKRSYPNDIETTVTRVNNVVTVARHNGSVTQITYFQVAEETPPPKSPTRTKKGNKRQTAIATGPFPPLTLVEEKTCTASSACLNVKPTLTAKQAFAMASSIASICQTGFMARAGYQRDTRLDVNFTQAGVPRLFS